MAEAKPLERFSWWSLPIIIGVTLSIALPAAVLFLAIRAHSTGELVVTLLFLGLFAGIVAALVNRMPAADYESKVVPDIPGLTDLVVDDSEFSHYGKYRLALRQRAKSEQFRILQETARLGAWLDDAVTIFNRTVQLVNLRWKRALTPSLLPRS